MKDTAVAKPWPVFAALLILGFAAIFALNHTGILGENAKPGGEDVATGIRTTTPAEGDEKRPHPDHQAMEPRAMNPEHGQPADEARQTAAAGGPAKRQSSSYDSRSQDRSEKTRPGKRSHTREDGGDLLTENTPSPTSTTSAAPPPGIQLAPDVRLPLAALPIDLKTNEVTARMLDIIVEDYYRDLAAGVTGEENDHETTLDEHNGETTIIVKNGPAAEKARQRADWRFRAIFGKEAFNRMSMQSNLEARLPVADAE